MKIHFVCSGNIFRSRLAESYARYRYQSRPDLIFSSSGILADTNRWGPIAWFTKDILTTHNLLSYASPAWTQTSAAILHQQDMVIFMKRLHLNYCQQHFAFTNSNFQIWNIPDITPLMSDKELLDFGQRTLEKIMPLVDRLHL